LKLEINNSTAGAGSGWDALNITGGLNLTATGGNKFKLELDSLAGSGQSGLLAGFNPASNYTWQFLTTTSAITGFSASAFDIDTTHFLNTFSGSFSVLMGSDSKSLSLQYLAVPEPGSGALLLAAGALLGARRRRRKTDGT
jgi:hypothetical protein